MVTRGNVRVVYGTYVRRFFPEYPMWTGGNLEESGYLHATCEPRVKPDVDVYGTTRRVFQTPSSRRILTFSRRCKQGLLEQLDGRLARRLAVTGLDRAAEGTLDGRSGDVALHPL